MHESRIADDCDDLAEAVLAERLFHAEGRAYACPHADTGVHGRKRLERRESITADVSRNKYPELRNRMEYAPVRASCAEVRRPHGDRDRLKKVTPCFSGDRLSYYMRIQFSHDRDQFLAFACEPQRLNMVLYEGVQFFDNEKLFYLRGKIPDHPVRERIGH